MGQYCDYCTDNARGDDDAANTEAGEDEEAIKLVQVVNAGDRQGTAACSKVLKCWCSVKTCKAAGCIFLTSSHENRRNDHQLLVVAPENTEEPEDNTRSG